MLLCKNCQSKDVFLDLTSSITLLGYIKVVGPVMQKLLDENGIQNRDVYPEHCKLVEKTIQPINTATLLNRNFECVYCGTKGPISRFDIIETCRCNYQTNQLAWCTNFGMVMCGNCIDPYTCDCCSFADCKSNPRNETGGYKKFFSFIRRL